MYRIASKMKKMNMHSLLRIRRLISCTKLASETATCGVVLCTAAHLGILEW